MKFNDMIKRQRLKKYRDETVVKRPFEEITINGHTLKCVYGEDGYSDPTYSYCMTDDDYATFFITLFNDERNLGEVSAETEDYEWEFKERQFDDLDEMKEILAQAVAEYIGYRESNKG